MKKKTGYALLHTFIALYENEDPNEVVKGVLVASNTALEGRESFGYGEGLSVEEGHKAREMLRADAMSHADDEEGEIQVVDSRTGRVVRTMESSAPGAFDGFMDEPDEKARH